MRQLPIVCVAMMLMVAGTLGLVTTNLSAAAYSHNEAAIPPDHPVIGTWRGTLTEPGEELPGIGTFSADGTAIQQIPAVLAVAPGVVLFDTAGFGAWEVTGDDSAAYTVQRLSSDGQGNVASVDTLSGTIQISEDRQTAAGEYVYSVVDPAGTVLAAGRGTVQYTRVTVVPKESLPTPVASPAVEAGPGEGREFTNNGVYMETGQ